MNILSLIQAMTLNISAQRVVLFLQRKIAQKAAGIADAVILFQKALQLIHTKVFPVNIDLTESGDNLLYLFNYFILTLPPDFIAVSLTPDVPKPCLIPITSSS